MTPLLLLFEAHKHINLRVEPLLRRALGDRRVPPVLNSRLACTVVTRGAFSPEYQDGSTQKVMPETT